MVRRLTRRGRQAAEARRVHREAAFHAAAEAIDTCRLLCELAVSANARSGSIGVAAVQGAAAACLVRVSENAARLLRDFARTNFNRSVGDIEQSDALGGDRRLKLREATRRALKNSSVAARELLLLGQYTDAVDSGSISRGEFAQARSDLAAFLFLVHGLAADLLRTEGTALKAAREALEVSGEKGDDAILRLRSRSSSFSDLEICASDADDEPIATRHSGGNLLLLDVPLLSSRRLRVGDRFKVVAATTMVSAVDRVRLLCSQTSASISSAVRQRWRIALKVSLAFCLSFCASLYLFGKDSTVVCTASLLSSYGSQYDGGSLRRSVSRIVGVVAGATFGSALEQTFVRVFANASWLVDSRQWRLHSTTGEDLQSCIYQGEASLSSLLLLWGVTFMGGLLNFSGGPHSYAGFCAGFTAAKFLLCSASGCFQVSGAITYTMYAASLAVAVEMCVLPIYAGDLLRVRLSGSLLGAAAVLSYLVTSEVSGEGVAMPTIATEALKQTRQMAAHSSTKGAVEPVLRQLQSVARQFSLKDLAKKEAAQMERGELPDLTARLQHAGILDQYVSFRESYMKWRAGESAGAKGELCAEVVHTSVISSPYAGEVLESIVEKEPSEEPDVNSIADERRSDQQDPASTVEAFAPPILHREASGLRPGTTMDPFAAVCLPPLASENAEVEESHVVPAEEATCRASAVFLKGADPAFVEGMAIFEEAPKEDGPAAAGAVSTLQHQEGALDQMPKLQELLAQSVAGMAPHVDSVHEPLAEATPRSTVSPAHWLLKTTSPFRRERSCESSGLAPVSLDVPSTGALVPALATTAGTAGISLATVQTLLDEMDSALAPAADLATQAGERLDAERVDTHMWRRLAGLVGVVRLRLSLLARIALRLQHGVSVPELMGGEEAAGKALVEAFGGALAVATAAVAGGAAPKPRLCAELEARLRASSVALSSSLARRRPPGALARTAAGSAEVTAEVLAGTAGNILTALLGDAAELLGYACALAGAPAAVDAAPAAPACPASSQLAGASVALDSTVAPLALPDLTERLKEAGMYDQYVQWREGYMQWRTGGGQSARGEMSKTTDS